MWHRALLRLFLKSLGNVLIEGQQEVQLCPNSITSILLKICLKPGLRHVADKSETKKVGDLVSDKIDLSRLVEIDLAGLRHVCDTSATFLSKIEAVEFRNDKRTEFSRQSTNQQPACYDVINDDINDS